MILNEKGNLIYLREEIRVKFLKNRQARQEQLIEKK